MNLIKKVLEDQKRCQRWLANCFGKSFNTVTDYIRNRQQPRLELLDEIANYFGVSNWDLLFGHNA